MKKNIISSVFFYFLAAAILVSCASTGGHSWISSPEKKYSSDKYIVAVGSGSSKATAESNAKLAICQQLGEKLSGSQRIVSSVDSKGKNYGAIDIDISEQAIFSHIHGISIKETASDLRKHTFYALAVLNKNDEITYYSSRIASSDMEISSLISSAQKLRGDIASLPTIKQAVKLAQDNEYCIQILSAIRSSGRPLVSYGGLNDVIQKAYDLAQAVTVSVDFSGDEAYNIEQSFVAVLKERGMNVVSSKDAKYILQGTSTIEPTEVVGQTLYVFVRYNVNAVLKSVSGAVVKNFEITGREGHLSISQAKNRALTVIKDSIEF